MARFFTRNMNKKNATINGKQVELAYCYATEINFANFTNGDNASTFIVEQAKRIEALNKGGIELPDIEKCIYLILSAALACAAAQNKECPIEDKDFLYTDNPNELYEALGQVILLYGEFYKLLPSDKKTKGNKGKN